MSLVPANFTDGTVTLSDDAGHSESLELSDGDTSISGLLPGGAAMGVYESQGHVIGARAEARAFPTITVKGTLAAPAADFHLLALGKTAGFVSTTADIGDYAANDLDFSFDYGAESRDITADDVVLTDISFEMGTPSTVSFSFQILGPLELDGTSIIDAR